ncbi:sugar-transfer associated ATP-grasp domain-containing protein [Arhodomonas sp. SL1]|uniref:sugar-transfer associated ATP-grasp domain-containing protein n=1 Tax=Arhodomonas sp. SL1 TaxID=3425691 RepID=UPI003F880BAD
MGGWRSRALQVPGIAVRLIAASRRYRTPLPVVARRFLWLYREGRFSPTEIFLLGLLDGALGPADLRRHVSKERLLAVQQRLNPPDAAALTEDKLRFSERCAAHGLATPPILAVVGVADDVSLPGTTNRLADGRSLCAYLVRECPSSKTILKPVGGVHGRGIWRLYRIDGGLRDGAGRRVDGPLLAGHMHGSGYDAWLVQELLEPHPQLTAYSGSRQLQTLRLVTVRDVTRVRMVAAWLRLVGGDAPFDNFNFGQSGNLLVVLEVASGQAERMIMRDPDGSALIERAAHPKTGRSVASLQVPFWSRAATLATEAAQAFAPLVTIGWDVAITPQGPVLIEGNVTWDPLPGQRDMGALCRELETRTSPSRKHSDPARPVGG